MSIEQTLSDALKQAMRDRDADRTACIRQLRAKVQEASNAKDFSGDVDDALYQRVIVSYIKQLENGIAQMDAKSERGQMLIQKYRSEIDYLGHYLPKTLDEAATRKLVQEALQALCVTDAKQAGRVMGHLMKQHKGEIDAALTKRIVGEMLQAAS